MEENIKPAQIEGFLSDAFSKLLTSHHIHKYLRLLARDHGFPIEITYPGGDEVRVKVISPGKVVKL